MHIIATSTKEDLIQLGTFFDFLNEVIHEYTSPYKDSDAFVRIVKPPPIVGWMALGNIGDKQKSFCRKQWNGWGDSWRQQNVGGFNQQNPL